VSGQAGCNESIAHTQARRYKCCCAGEYTYIAILVQVAHSLWYLLRKKISLTWGIEYAPPYH